MKVGIDISGLGQKPRTGVQSYYYGLLRAFAELDSAALDAAVLVLLDWHPRAGVKRELPLKRHVRYRSAEPLAWLPKANVAGVASRPLRLAVRAYARAAGAVRRSAQSLDAERSMFDGLDLVQVYGWNIRKGPRKNVVMVPDVIPLLFPETHDARLVSKTKAIVAFARAEADGVITLSQHSKQDLVEVGGVAPEKIEVAPLGVDPVFHPCDQREARDAVLRRYGLAGMTYALSVGFLHPRKNLTAHIEAFERVVQGGRAGDLRLVLAGPEIAGTEKIMARIAASPLRERIIVTGYVPPADLPAVYQGASVLLYCSLYEGFGLPVLEAMACGTPVVASNRSSLPEVCGEAALLVEPSDSDGIAEAMQSVLCDEDLRRALTRRGLCRAAQFTWAECARRHLQVYRRCCGG